MKGLLYRTLAATSERLGIWVFRLFAWFICTGYFFLFPGRVRTGLRFYAALFPDRGRLQLLGCTWRQYHNFTGLFVDRILLKHEGAISFTSSGLRNLGEAVKTGTGGIILMSHVGGWEAAALLLKRALPGIRLLLYMGKKGREEIEEMQKRGAVDAGIRVIALDREGGSPLDIVEGLRFLRDGGFVSMTGDLLWRGDQRKIAVEFLGHEAFLPETPHLLALISGTPLFIFFSYRERRGAYSFSIKGPFYVKAVSRRERNEAVTKSARQYAALLERTVREHPFQWYHFEPFLGRKVMKGEKTGG